MSSHVVFACGLLAFLSLVITCTAMNLTGPCRSWLFHCGTGSWRCSSIEHYQQLFTGPLPVCPVPDTPTAPLPPAAYCDIVDGACQFTNTTTNCTTWSVLCPPQFQCGTQEERNRSLSETSLFCPSLSDRIPEPTSLCVPINGSCEWFNPCKAWRGYCQGSYQCGSLDEYYRFVNQPQPLCSPPPEGWVPPTPPGQCIAQDGQCSWSNCTSWLDWCQTSWQCGTQYDLAIYRSGPIPSCPFPREDYVPPSPPGDCTFQTDTQTCGFGQCSGGKQYTTCGTACPLTCDNYFFSVPCITLCVPGCFCPNGTVDYNGVCVATFLCPPIIDLCALVDCQLHYQCKVGPNEQPECIPTCGDNNGGCRTDQKCVVDVPECTTDDPFCFSYPSLVCLDPPYLPCEATNELSQCSDARCLVKNSTGMVHCVESCYQDNGGCGSNSICFSQLNDVCPSREFLDSCETHVECRELSQLAGDQCPPGLQYSIGSVCEPTCESYLRGILYRPCVEIGVEGCFCPFGTVLYRDRCVDPRECYVLVNDPPPFNILPVNTPNVVLMLMTAVNSDVRSFKEVASSFVISSQRLVNDKRVKVILHGYYEDVDGLKIVLQISSGVDYPLKSNDIIQLFRANSASLPVQVDSIQMVETQTIPPAPTLSNLSSGAIAGIIVAAVVLLLAVVLVTAALITIIIILFRRLKVSRVNPAAKADHSTVTYAKLDKNETAISVIRNPTDDAVMTFEPSEEKPDKVDLSQVEKTS